MRMKTALIFMSVFLLLLENSPSWAEGKIFTDDEVSRFLGNQEDFDKSHSMMTRQRERLQAILTAFLVGDVYTIREKSDEILKGMREVTENYAWTGEKETETWKAVTGIINETRLMQEEASKDDYAKAYVHFARAAHNCIQCHQAVRGWGQLSEPAPPQVKKTSPA